MILQRGIAGLEGIFNMNEGFSTFSCRPFLHSQMPASQNGFGKHLDPNSTSLQTLQINKQDRQSFVGKGEKNLAAVVARCVAN